MSGANLINYFCIHDRYTDELELMDRPEGGLNIWLTDHYAGQAFRLEYVMDAEQENQLLGFLLRRAHRDSRA